MKMYDFFHAIANFFWQKHVNAIKKGGKKNAKTKK